MKPGRKPRDLFMAQESKSNDIARITDTPEFKTAVAEAAAKATAEAIAQLGKAGSLGAPGLGQDATELFSRLALAIAEVSDQGTQRKRVAPEILAQRAAARKRAIALVSEVNRQVKLARDNKDKVAEAKWMPEYKLIAKVVLNERLIEPFKRLADKSTAHNEIYWTGMPNQAMRPLNAIAKQIWDEYVSSIGSVERVNARAGEKPYLTPGGLLVKGEPPKRREGFSDEVPKFADDLEVKHENNDPSAPFVHVLGTIASPARQNYAESERRS